jgi:hypothetical protein
LEPEIQAASSYDIRVEVGTGARRKTAIGVIGVWKSKEGMSGLSLNFS